ncbi:hypothetical protein TNCV_1158301 [Trichonephila clavipes]|nr:hypothetical protein TNCV_1158301 [Trichonephila clavipes]
MGSNLYTGGIFVDGSNLYTGGIFVDGSNLYTGGTKFSKNGGASPPRTAFVHVPNFDQNRNFFQSRPLHRRSIHAEFKPLHRLNEVSKKWRSVSFTDAFVHCPDFGSKSKFYRSRPSPHNLWETTRGPRRLSFFYFILKLKQKLIKKVAILTDKFDDDMQKVTPARAPPSFSFFLS